MGRGTMGCRTGEVFQQAGIVLFRVDAQGRLAERWSGYVVR